MKHVKCVSEPSYGWWTWFPRISMCYLRDQCVCVCVFVMGVRLGMNDRWGDWWFWDWHCLVKGFDGWAPCVTIANFYPSNKLAPVVEILRTLALCFNSSSQLIRLILYVICPKYTNYNVNTVKKWVGSCKSTFSMHWYIRFGGLLGFVNFWLG